MSSHKPATAQAGTSPADLSGQAQQIAAEVERGLAEGRVDVISPETLQVLMAALCRAYAAQVEAGSDVGPLAGRSIVSPTDVMVTASGLLKAADLQVFELGMWQSWTGR
jgi:hypothetical protein